MLNSRTEGDARTATHALACHVGGCDMACRCWCHGITKRPNGAEREDIAAIEELQLTDKGEGE